MYEQVNAQMNKLMTRERQNFGLDYVLISRSLFDKHVVPNRARAHTHTHTHIYIYISKFNFVRDRFSQNIL